MKCMFCYFLYIWTLQYLENDVHIVNSIMETAFIMYYDIISSNDIIKREQSDPGSLT